jgi:hypothetical protein
VLQQQKRLGLLKGRNQNPLERVEDPGPSQITAHGSVAQNNYGTHHYPPIPSLSNSLLRGSCSSDASPLVSNSPEAITSIYDPISSHIPIKMKENGEGNLRI